MNGNWRLERSDAGVALITSLALLFIFSLLGGAFLTYMVYEKQETDNEFASMRSRLVAQAGIQAAIGELGAALKGNTELPTTLEVPIANYGPAAEGSLAASGTVGKATVTISDENARINLNQAPTRVLAAILGIDHGAARTIQNSLPRQDGEAFETAAPVERRWLASVDELVTRGLMDPALFTAVNKDLVSVYSAGSADAAAGYINVNTAPPEVLAALFALSAEEAAQVAAKRPFQAMDQLVAATGKEPGTFNVSAPADAPGGLPKELAFASRCFRIVSESAMENAQAGQRSGLRIEAVVLFNDAGEPSIRYWNATPGKAVNDTSTPAAEAPADTTTQEPAKAA